MPKGANQKFKLYRLAQIMCEKTDETHYLTMPEIQKELEKYDIIAERRSLYESLKDLEEFGIEVEGERSGRGYRYHVIGRQFELAELKLLVDAIQSSKFITEKMTNRLIGKLETLVSQHDAADLRRQVFVSGRIKTMNETVYYSVDTIYNAISQNKKLNFNKYKGGNGWSYEEFYKKSSDKEADLFLCLENGLIYIPGENELFLYIG